MAYQTGGRGGGKPVGDMLSFLHQHFCSLTSMDSATCGQHDAHLGMWKKEKAHVGTNAHTGPSEQTIQLKSYLGQNECGAGANAP